jgi:uncharacterized protein YukE
VVDLSKDPTPGEVWGVKALARGYQSVADGAEEAGSILTRVRSTGASGVWIGEAGDAFREKIEDLPDHLDKCVDSFTKAADALFGWATKMSTLQSSADTNLERARLAADDLEAAYQNTEPPKWVSVPTAGELSRLRSQNASASSGVSSERTSVDDAQARLDAAKKLVWEAKEDYETAAKQVVRKIEDAKDAGVPGDSWWEKIKNSDWWQVVVTIATVVVVIAAIVAIVFTGPVALIAMGVGLVIGAVLVADDVMSLASGEMAPGEFLAMTAIGLLPGGRGARAAAKATSAAADASRAAGRGTGAATKVTRSADTGAVVGSSKPRPYLDPASRPSFRKGVVDDTWAEAQRRGGGTVRDPYTDEVIQWAPGTSRRGVWDMGHLPDHKYAEVHRRYVNGEMTPAQFRNWYNNPDHYVPQTPASNRSHKYE